MEVKFPSSYKDIRVLDFGKRRGKGRQIITKYDDWAALGAIDLCFEQTFGSVPSDQVVGSVLKNAVQFVELLLFG